MRQTPTGCGKQVLRVVLILRQHPQHQGLEGWLDNFDLELNGEEVMSKRDVSVRQLSSKRARSSLQWVQRVPVASDMDLALMTFSDEEPGDYDPFELGFEMEAPCAAVAITGSSSSSSSSSCPASSGSVCSYLDGNPKGTDCHQQKRITEKREKLKDANAV